MGAQPSLAADPGRIAIIDASKNTKAHLDTLAAAGVQVIGRYYARCAQAGLEEKRLIGNPGEIDAILSHPARFGVLSIYQFYNNSPLKFSGQRETTCKLPNGRTRKIKVTLADDTCREREIDKDCHEAEGPPRTLAMEAQWDAEAAVRQARQVRPACGHRHLFRRRLQRRRRHRAVRIGVFQDRQRYPEGQRLSGRRIRQRRRARSAEGQDALRRPVSQARRWWTSSG